MMMMVVSQVAAMMMMTLTDSCVHFHRRCVHGLGLDGCAAVEAGVVVMMMKLMMDCSQGASWEAALLMMMMMAPRIVVDWRLHSCSFLSHLQPSCNANVTIENQACDIRIKTAS